MEWRNSSERTQTQITTSDKWIKSLDFDGGMSDNDIAIAEVYELITAGNYDDADALAEQYSINGQIMKSTLQHLRVSKHLNANYTSETYVQNQFDPVRKIKNRKLFGTGVRMKLLEKNFIGVSTFYELEALTNDVVNKDIRLSTYLQLDFDISEKIQFLTTTYIQPNVKQFADFKLSTESQLNFEITKNLSFTNSIEAIYDTFPASRVKEFSYSLQNGIKFNF